MDDKNIVDEVIGAAGNITKLAQKMDVSHQLVSHWRKKGRFPINRIADVHRHFPQFSYQYLVDNAKY